MVTSIHLAEEKVLKILTSARKFNRSHNKMWHNIGKSKIHIATENKNITSDDGEEPCRYHLSLAGCGFLGMYHLGAVKALRDHGGDFLSHVDKFSGASAGALVAAALTICGSGDDILQVKIYIPKADSDETTSSTSDYKMKEYTYKELPQKYWKKYEYASKFVRLVRSKTPKVTLYTTKAKCTLMESLTDFEVVFYDGSKLCYREDSTRLIQGNGSCLTFDSPDDLKNLVPHMWKYVEGCRQHCCNVEKTYSAVESSVLNEMPFFPLIIGKRPGSPDYEIENLQSVSTSPRDNGLQRDEIHRENDHICPSYQSIKNNDNCQDISPTYTDSTLDKIHRTTSASLSNTDYRMNQSTSSEGSNNSKRSGPFVVCKVCICSIGWATQWSNGEISVQYMDGCEMSIQSNPIVISFTDVEGTRMHFTQSDSLPVTVRQKMDDLSVVMEKLEAAQSSHITEQ